MAKVGRKPQTQDRYRVEVPHHGLLTFEVFEGGESDPGFYWHLKAKNGEILAVSESYTQKGAAKRTMLKVASLMTNFGASLNTEEIDGKPVVTHKNLKRLDNEHGNPKASDPNLKTA